MVDLLKLVPKIFLSGMLRGVCGLLITLPLYYFRIWPFTEPLSWGWAITFPFVIGMIGVGGEIGTSIRERRRKGPRPAGEHGEP
ncbi:hypothetical protein [Streptosporangium sandarakinum]|uniref:hypothetical protein n=1 Tax=Streptosporangium sandarakinum TaxID=1260955 RepID=UPI00341AC8E5